MHLRRPLPSCNSNFATAEISLPSTTMIAAAPTTALSESCSRDPIGYGGSKRNLCKSYLLLNRIDPSGKGATCDAIYNSAVKCATGGRTPSTLEERNYAQVIRHLQDQRTKCNGRLSPAAVALAVELALQELDLNSIDPAFGDEDKAKLTDEDVETILIKVDNEVAATTISGDSAIAIPIRNSWELKLYSNDGNWTASVGFETQSWSHYDNAASWLLGNSPNADNGESFGNFQISDSTSRNALERLKAMDCSCPFKIGPNSKPLSDWFK